MKKFCLFEGRHELPPNNGAICSDFDFDSFKAVKTEKWAEAMDIMLNGGNIGLYVTGLTPALTEFLQEAASRVHGITLKTDWMGSVILYHYDRESKSYREQK